MKVSIIIPSLNGKTILERNLPKVFDAFQDLKNNILEIIIVDDGSSDDTVLFLNKFYKDKIKLIKHTKNRGFSASVNTGARAAKGDILLLLNNDVIPEINFLESSLTLFNNKKVFAVSLHEKGYGSGKGQFKDGFIQLSMGEENDKNHHSFYVSGGSGLFRKSIWKELCGMDEKLLSPFYWEDIDLCFRALKRGYINLWEPGGKVIHDHESTISTLPKKYVDRIKERNQLLVIWKNIHSKNLMQKHVLGVLKRILKHPGYIRVVFMALMRLKCVLKARKKEIKESKVSDEAIFSMFS